MIYLTKVTERQPEIVQEIVMSVCLKPKEEYRMGLFSKKPKRPEYDVEDCTVKKKRMREIFNEAVKDGDTYEILYADMSTSKFERGFVFNTNTTTFFFYIVGFRQYDFSLVLVQTDAELQEYTEPFYVDMDNVSNVSYNPKIHQLCFEYKKGSKDFGELLNIGGSSSRTVYGPKNIYQPDEIEKILNFAEAFRAKLEQKGYKLDKWKR